MIRLIERRLQRFQHRFSRATDGVAAVEFGLLVPLLFIMFIGTLEIGQAVGLDRRVSMATASTPARAGSGSFLSSSIASSFFRPLHTSRIRGAPGARSTSTDT